MKRGALNRDPKVRALPVRDIGKVQAGGPGSFDATKGRYSAPPQGSERLSPGVYRAPGGQLMTGQGRPLPRPQPMAMPIQPQVQQPTQQGFGPKFPYEQQQLDMMKPWLNAQPPQMPQMQQRPSFGQVANASGEQINQWLQLAQQARQPQQFMQLTPEMQQLPPELLAQFKGRFNY
jgi:hypothetical protein